MRRFAPLAFAVAVLALGLSHDSAAQATGTKVFQYAMTGGASPFSGTAPAATACNPAETAHPRLTGLPMQGLKGYYVCVAAMTAGNSLAGAGTIRLYYWNPDITDWTRENAADETITVASAVDEPICFPMRRVDLVARSGSCLYAIPNGVTTSGGTALTVQVLGVY